MGLSTDSETNISVNAAQHDVPLQITHFGQESFCFNGHVLCRLQPVNEVLVRFAMKTSTSIHGVQCSRTTQIKIQLCA